MVYFKRVDFSDYLLYVYIHIMVTYFVEVHIYQFSFFMKFSSLSFLTFSLTQATLMRTHTL